MLHYWKTVQKSTVHQDTGAGAADSLAQLRSFIEKLEERLHPWLLVLDNADSYEDFAPKETATDSISTLLPKKGNIIITTRDPRFLGRVTKPGNGVHVEAMARCEACELLRVSVAGHLWSRDPPADVEVDQCAEALYDLPARCGTSSS